jgi:hypothetical protein
MKRAEDKRTGEVYFCRKCGSEMVMFSDDNIRRGVCMDLGCNDFGILVCCGENVVAKKRKGIIDMILR